MQTRTVSSSRWLGCVLEGDAARRLLDDLSRESELAQNLRVGLNIALQRVLPRHLEELLTL
eukprot:2433305-Pyramimonas_sp.AAC.1